MVLLTSGVPKQKKLGNETKNKINEKTGKCKRLQDSTESNQDADKIEKNYRTHTQQQRQMKTFFDAAECNPAIIPGILQHLFIYQ